MDGGTEGNGAAFPVGVGAGTTRTGGSALRPAPRPARPSPPLLIVGSVAFPVVTTLEPGGEPPRPPPPWQLCGPGGASRSLSVGWWGNAMVQARERSGGRRTAPLTLRCEEPRKPFPSIPRPALAGGSREAQATVRQQPNRRASDEPGSPGATPREGGSAGETGQIPLVRLQAPPVRPRFHW